MESHYNDLPSAQWEPEDEIQEDLDVDAEPAHYHRSHSVPLHSVGSMVPAVPTFPGIKNFMAPILESHGGCAHYSNGRKQIISPTPEYGGQTRRYDSEGAIDDDEIVFMGS
jgi:hypothetical protein